MSSDPYIYFFLETRKTRAAAVERNPDRGMLYMCFDIQNSIQNKIPPVSVPALIRKVIHATNNTRFFNGVGTTQKTSSNLLQRCLYFPHRVWNQAIGFNMSEPTFHCILSAATIAPQKIRFFKLGLVQRVAYMTMWVVFVLQDCNIADQ